uniref:Alpha/beta hydrolase domain-containing protein 17C n=1 Tax=Equus caballus TaxID=9796 RepID=A0A9L0RND4_HORSE
MEGGEMINGAENANVCRTVLIRQISDRYQSRDSSVVELADGFLTGSVATEQRSPVCVLLYKGSIDKISKVTSPVLVIHGTEDEVIDFSHGLAMYERCPRAVEPLWVEGAGHNDIELYAQYLERLKQFISHELPNS